MKGKDATWNKRKNGQEEMKNETLEVTTIWDSIAEETAYRI